MSAVQDILVFFQTTPALDVQVVAWARYEDSKGTGLDMHQDSVIDFRDHYFYDVGERFMRRIEY